VRRGYQVQGDPFQFVWPVDQDGYEIWRNPHDDETAQLLSRRETAFIRPRGGLLRYYRPLEVDGLWLRFAESCKSIDGALSFANEFGCIFELHDEFPDAAEQIGDFLNAAEVIRQISERIEAGDRISAAKILNHTGRPLVTETVRYDERTAAFEHVLVPVTLMSALLHQAAQAISGDRHFRRCRNEGCPNWFRVGPRAHTARREFCSDRCRVASARRQKKEGIDA